MKTFELISRGPQDARNNESLYPGFVRGSEVEWSSQQGSVSQQYALPLLQNMLSEDLSFEPLEFNWASDVGLVDAQISPLIDSMGTNLGEFKARGGKLLVSQGWADPLNGQTLPIKHLDEIAKATGGRREDWLALYMIPGNEYASK